MRDICDDDGSLFGGKTVVFGGDFQQTLPVIPGGSQEEIISQSLPRSYIWNSLHVLHLHVNIRLLGSAPPHSDLTDEQSFADWLLLVGHGKDIDEIGTIAFDPQMRVNDLTSLITSIYPNLSNFIPPSQYFLDRMILAPKNTDVDFLNSTILEDMPGDDAMFYSADSIESEPGTDSEQESIPVEFLCSLESSGLPSGELRVKPGCLLILLRNLAPGRGLCNGTRMIFKRASQCVLVVEIIGGKHNGELAFIPRITLIPSVSERAGFIFQLRCCQFPV